MDFVKRQKHDITKDALSIQMFSVKNMQIHIENAKNGKITADELKEKVTEWKSFWWNLEKLQQ
jgi:hypothetical protein